MNLPVSPVPEPRRPSLINAPQQSRLSSTLRDSGARPPLTRRRNVTSEIRGDNFGKIAAPAWSHDPPPALKGDVTRKSSGYLAERLPLLRGAHP